MPSSKLFKTWAEIDLGAIRYNIGQIRKIIGAKAKILLNVKADAYGHGAYQISRVALESGVEWLGVSHVKEALELRSYFPRVPILIVSSGMLGHTHPIVRNNLTPVVCSLEIARALGREAVRAGKRINIHVMVDTGMGRIGVWHKNCLPFLIRLSRVKGINLSGICSHFAAASEPDPAFARLQLKRFLAVIKRCEAKGVVFPLKHIANTSALLRFPDSCLDMVRPGLSVYGAYPAPYLRRLVKLKPALSLKTRIAFLKSVNPGRTISYGLTHKVRKKTRIATLPIGYADGFSRFHSRRGRVLIQGVKVPIVGTVTMDQIMVDVGKVPEVRVGDEAVLIGEQQGERITAEEAAERIGTISYEVLAQLGKRVSRVYTHE